MARALILFAHPCPESYGAALHQCVFDTLTGRGWEVDDCDLYLEGFNPVLSESERRGYLEMPENVEPVRGYVDRLRAADSLILIFPVWFYGFPAILKGFFDRVFLPGVSFTLEHGQLKPNLTNIIRLAAITTYGGSRLRTFLMGDPPRKVICRSLSRVCHPKVKLQYLALHAMDQVTAAQRTAHLAKVQRAMLDF